MGKGWVAFIDRIQRFCELTYNNCGQQDGTKVRPFAVIHTAYEIFVIVEVTEKFVYGSKKGPSLGVYMGLRLHI